MGCFDARNAGECVIGRPVEASQPSCWASLHVEYPEILANECGEPESKLAKFSEYWQLRTVSQFNGRDIMVVKAKGEFVWHRHDGTDDSFLVLKGNLTNELRERSVNLGPGELFVVPWGVERRPVATGEFHILVIGRLAHPIQAMPPPRQCARSSRASIRMGYHD